MFVNYSYEHVKVEDLNPRVTDPRYPGGNPFLADSLLIGQGGQRTISKIGPSYVYNTVDSPIFPTRRRALHARRVDVAGLGGNTKFFNPRGEIVRYWAQTRRTSLGFRASVEYIRPLGRTSVLPIFEKMFHGGEYRIRGFDIRTIGPRDPISGVVIGGNKSVLGNVEYLINIAGPVRLVLFATTPARCATRARASGGRKPTTSSDRRPAPSDPDRPVRQHVAVGQRSTTRAAVSDAGAGARDDRRDQMPSSRRSARKSGSSCRCSTCRSG